ncbi:hypothetical protein J6590_002636, partial [Homalodisca vitripennis]
MGEQVAQENRTYLKAENNPKFSSVSEQKERIGRTREDNLLNCLEQSNIFLTLRAGRTESPFFVVIKRHFYSHSTTKNGIT